MDDRNSEECTTLQSVDSEGVLTMEEELDDLVPQDLCHIKMEDEEAEEEETGVGRGICDSRVDPLAYPGDSYFSCQYCDFQTPAFEILKEHILKRREEQCPISCWLCTFSCREQSSLREHLQSWHGEEHPSSSADWSPASRRHSSAETARAESGKRPFGEKFRGACLPVFPLTTEEMLAVHPDSKRHSEEKSTSELLPKSEGVQMSRTTLKEAAASSDTASVASRRYVCDVCRGRFTKLSNLKAHFRTHTKEKPFTCEVCQARFTQRGHLKIHQRSHSNEKPYACDVCQGRFTKLCNLKMHLRIHTNEKPYACDLCQARFTQLGNLKSHYRAHTKEKPFACDICSARFTQLSSVKTHKRLHTNEKPYTCDLCPARFTHLTSITAHKRTHTKEKPYLCNCCQARFTQLGSLKAHRKTFHD